MKAKVTKTKEPRAAKPAKTLPSSAPLESEKPTRKPLPSPGQIVAEARGEIEDTDLTPYLEAIQILRETKGFSYRRISVWLKERGIDVDHNEVYREYQSHMTTAAEVEHDDRRNAAEETHEHGH